MRETFSLDTAGDFCHILRIPAPVGPVENRVSPGDGVGVGGVRGEHMITKALDRRSDELVAAR